VIYVHELNDFGGLSPKAYHVFKINGTIPNRINEHANTAASLPILKMTIHRVLAMFERANQK
jgi:hypothetical protein